MKSWIEVSQQRLAANYRAACQVLAGEAGHDAALLAVVKADAYGHGAAVCAPILAAAGAPWLGVTDATEGTVVRAAMEAAGIERARQPAVLVMCGHLPEEAAEIVQQGLTPVVWNQEQTETLLAVRDQGQLAVHLEVDTGMSRQGVSVGETLRGLLQWLAGQPLLRLDGVMTHFASAEVAGSPQTQAQRERFEAALAMVDEAGLRPGWVHAGNTSALDNGADGGTLAWLHGLAKRLGARAMVREGLGLYGYCLPLEGLVASDGANAVRLGREVLPVMTWKTRVLTVSEVRPGDRVGYNGTFVAERRMRLALLPVGYADGLRRELSNSQKGAVGRSGGWVMVGGRRARIVGRVSMNLTTVDVTDLPGVGAGDEVVLLGDGVTAEDHAALAGTIAYEILCTARAPVVAVPVPICAAAVRAVASSLRGNRTMAQSEAEVSKTREAGSTARRTEDIALDLLKFVATTANVGAKAAGSSVGFGVPSAAKSDDQVDHLLELYARCRQAVEAPGDSE